MRGCHYAFIFLFLFEWFWIYCTVLNLGFFHRIYFSLNIHKVKSFIRRVLIYFPYNIIFNDTNIVLQLKI